MKSKKKLIALAAVLGVTAIGGTFAYFNQTLTATNIFDTGTYDTELVEEFKPSEGENWELGSNVNKDVTIKNTGTLPIVVRVKFQEKWVSRTTGEILYEMDSTVNKDSIGASLGLASPSDAQNKFEAVYQGNADDGETGVTVDDSVVYKQMIPDGEWVYNPADGYYYCTRVLAGKTKDADGNEVMDETAKILDGVTLAENADMGAYQEVKYYAVTESRPEDENDWIEFATASNAAGADRYLSAREMSEKVQSEGSFITFMKSETRLVSEKLAGYSNADYSLIITAQTVQATDMAVKELFGDLDVLKALGCDWNLKSESEIWQ